MPYNNHKTRISSPSSDQNNAKGLRKNLTLSKDSYYVYKKRLHHVHLKQDNEHDVA